MRAQGIIDQRGIGSGDAGERIELAEMVHAHFDNGITLLRPQGKQGERQADMVVEIAGGGQHSRFAELAAQDGGQHFLHRGFAGRTGDAEHQRVHRFAPSGSQGLQRRQRVGHRQAT